MKLYVDDKHYKCNKCKNTYRVDWYIPRIYQEKLYCSTCYSEVKKKLKLCYKDYTGNEIENSEYEYPTHSLSRSHVRNTGQHKFTAEFNRF